MVKRLERERERESIHTQQVGKNTRETDRQTDRERERQRQTDRQTQRHRQTQRDTDRETPGGAHMGFSERRDTILK